MKSAAKYDNDHCIYPHSELTALKLEEPERPELSTSGLERIELDLTALKADDEQIKTMMWFTAKRGLVVAEKYDKWLSKYLFDKDSGMHLVHYPLMKPVKIFEQIVEKV